MRTGIYASAKGAILGQTLSLLAAGIKAMPLNSLYSPDFSAHATLSDVPSGARIVSGVALANKTLVQAGTGYKFDADDVTFSSVPNPSSVYGVLLYLDGGSDASSKLIGYFDYFSGLPKVVTSGSVTFQWPAYAIFVLDDGVLGGPQGAPGTLGTIPNPVNGVLGKLTDTSVRTSQYIRLASDGALEVGNVWVPYAPATQGDIRFCAESSIYTRGELTAKDIPITYQFSATNGQGPEERLLIGWDGYVDSLIWPFSPAAEGYTPLTNGAFDQLTVSAVEAGNFQVGWIFNPGEIGAYINIVSHNGFNDDTGRTARVVQVMPNLHLQTQDVQAYYAEDPFAGGLGYFLVRKRRLERSGPLDENHFGLWCDETTRHPMVTIDDTDYDLLGAGAATPEYVDLAAAALGDVALVDSGAIIQTVHISGNSSFGVATITGFESPPVGVSRFVFLVVRNALGTTIVPESGESPENGIEQTLGTPSDGWHIPAGGNVLFVYQFGDEGDGRWVAVAWNERAMNETFQSDGGLVIDFANADYDFTTANLRDAALRAKYLVFITSVTQTADRKITLPQPDSGGEDSAGTFGVKEWKVRNRSTAAFKLTLVGDLSDTGGDKVVLGPDDSAGDGVGKCYAEIACTPNGVKQFGWSNKNATNDKTITVTGT